MKILSSFTQPHVIPNLYEFLFFCSMLVTRQLINTTEVNRVYQLSGYQHYSKYLILYSAEERNSYRFGIT